MVSVKGMNLKIFAGALALICLIVGIYLTFFHSKGFVKTSAKIIAVREETVDDGTVYYPTVEYVVDGVTYTGDLNTGSGSYKVGKRINVRYDPDNPSVVHDGGGVGIYLLVVSTAILVIIIISTIQENRNQKQAREIREARGRTGYAPSVQGEERELYFLTDVGTAKYGHRIEDKDRRILYEAKMTRFSMTQAYGFDFVDHENLITTPHLVGHEVETDWNSFLLDNNYTFELDGEDIWEHLKNNGVNVETERMDSTIWPRFRVSRDGVEIAIIESSSRYVHEEDARQHPKLSELVSPGYYRIRTREKNLDVVFVTAMAFARSGALNNEGGTYGKIIRNAFKKK